MVTDGDCTNNYYPGGAHCPKTPPEHSEEFSFIKLGVLQSRQGADPDSFPGSFHQLGDSQSLGKEREWRNLRMEQMISSTSDKQTVSSPCILSICGKSPRQDRNMSAYDFKAW